MLHFLPETGVCPMTKLIEKLPDVAEVVLDKCISYSPLPPSHEDFSVKFNLRHLEPHVNSTSGFAPATMAKHRRERLLKHIVTQALLRYKWMVLGKLFTIFNTILFAVFVILFSSFVVKERDKSTLFSDVSNTSTSGNINEKSSFEEIAPLVIMVFLMFYFLKELTQLLWMRLAYFKSISNLIELVMYSMIQIFMLPIVFKEGVYSAETQWNAGLVGLFLCYINLTLHFRRFGGLGLYVTMYVEVFWTFLKVISTFLIALIGYSVVFYVLLKHQVCELVNRFALSPLRAYSPSPPLL